jgi:hypothetical protein
MEVPTHHLTPRSTYTGYPDYKCSTYNVMIEWENGEITSEPLKMIAKDGPVTCTVYAKDNGLLDTI